MKKSKNNLIIRFLVILSCMILVLMSSTVMVFADVENTLTDLGEQDADQGITEVVDVEDDESFLGLKDNETGYTEVYRKLLEFVQAYLNPTISIFTAVAMLYAVVLGVKYAKEEDQQGREKVKQAIKNLIKGMILIYVIYVVLTLFMPVFANYAAARGDEMDHQNLQNVSSNETEATDDVYANRITDQTIADLRNSGNDNNNIIPNYTVVAGEEDENDPNNVSEGGGDGADGTAYENLNGTPSTTSDSTSVDSLKAAVSSYRSAYSDYAANPQGSKGATSLYSIVKTAANKVSSALSAVIAEYGDPASDVLIQAEIDSAKQCISQYNNITEE